LALGTSETLARCCFLSAWKSDTLSTAYKDPNRNFLRRSQNAHASEDRRPFRVIQGRAKEHASTQAEDSRRLARLLKRGQDVVLSLMALAVLSLPMALIAALIKLDSSGPVLYVSERVGKNKRHFRFFKFRTMISGAEQHKQELDCFNERNGPFFKMRNDPRITALGRFLRKYSLDELPQLWNVLRGDMSLVGPRPHPIEDVCRYRPEHFCRLEVIPGLTGLWQVKARRNPSFDLNVALDVEYIENWSLWLDLKILIHTIPAVFSGSGE
jgi:lipopolysaccharide/colanic/teichoic acid biosynthesis glycosyltransferase